MTEGKTVQDFFKNAQTVSLFSNLLMLLVSPTGELKRMSQRDFADQITPMVFNSTVYATNIDDITSPGLYVLDGVNTIGTLPNFQYGNYGHLLVLVRSVTVQQVYIGREGIALRFKSSPEWGAWKHIVAT